MATLVDSLMAVELMHRIEADLRVTVPVAVFFDGSRLGDLAGIVLDQLADAGEQPAVTAILDEFEQPLADRGSPTAMSVAAMIAEAVLDPAIDPASARAPMPGDPTAILLTGATGFLGAFLLHELLRQTGATVHCLVRAATLDEAGRRIETNLRAYLPDDEHDLSRVQPIVGDLGVPLLGLTAAQFQRLADQIDVIHHCGAMVRWTFPYKALKPANVHGTHEVLRLACARRLKPVHFVSTVGVFASASLNRAVIHESDPLEVSGPLNVGYAQSKWVAEKLVRQAGARGLPVTIYRPNTTGDSRTGISNPHDHVALMLRGCVQMGVAPDLDFRIDGAPVDYVSRALVYLAGRSQRAGQTFHLLNPRGIEWNDLCGWLRSAGYALHQVPYEEWVRRLLAAVRSGRDNALKGLSPMFADGSFTQARLPNFDCSQTLAALEGCSLRCPPLDATLLMRYLQPFHGAASTVSS